MRFSYRGTQAACFRAITYSLSPTQEGRVYLQEEIGGFAEVRNLRGSEPGHLYSLSFQAEKLID